MTAHPSRTVVVAGAGSDIGAAVAGRLARTGCRIALVDRRENHCYRALERVTAADGQAQIFTADVSLIHEAEAAVARIVDAWGPPDVLVHDLLPQRRPLDAPATAREDDWDGVVRSRLRAPYVLTAAVQRHMVRRRWGRIVLVSAPRPPAAEEDPAAAAALAGLFGLTRSLATRLGPHGVTANTVVPGLIATESAELAAACAGSDLNQLRKRALERVAVGRPGTADEVAEAVAFFASEQAGFVSGQVLHVTGGPTD
ncbi:SDR family NAD(P)-dependent oxidoreductase [Streptacidiphilus monticola]|jgi:3-oxoacyl-[acyl-carrier protein] reductase|uniref:SDR family NAD(P)-dependent oxidoreductase n=1 Tax=Streptacidiphilus monticola TaxID=2161674 RepID=A0ABW1GC32_9ACTN